jgi:N-acetylglutamate synthase-like GNAT family acetyltransferase
MDVQFGYLVNYPHFVPTLARWHFDAFGHLNPVSSLDRHQTFLKRTLQKDAIPTTLIVFSGDVLVGSASIVKYDLQDKMTLTPWLAAVYIAPAYRERGVGAALVQRMVDEANALGYHRLHLFTPDKEHFYTQLGWVILERTIYRGIDIVIMFTETGNK